MTWLPRKQILRRRGPHERLRIQSAIRPPPSDRPSDDRGNPALSETRPDAAFDPLRTWLALTVRQGRRVRVFGGTHFRLPCLPHRSAGARMNEEDSTRLRTAASPRRARPQDAGALTRLFTAAFLNDPVMDWMARSGPKRTSGLEALFFRLLYGAIPAGEVWMSDDGAACAIWLPPGVPARPVGVAAQLRRLPLFVQVCGFGRLARGAALSGAMEKAHPREKHFYLFFMAVNPRLHGKGLGSAILDATLKHIDQTGTAAYLENSNPRNARLYERTGFVAQNNISPEGAPPLIPMWRTAR
jgi:ribosomal protein S18 acetylase RimI-like enzyme